MSTKLPYIPLYIGDWEQDVNSISLEAEGALVKLTFKLWKSKTKGEITTDLEAIALLFKKPPEIAVKILRELSRNDVLNVEYLDQNQIKIESRRLTKEARISKVRSESGSGGKKQNSSKTEAKGEQTHDIDNDIDIVIEILNTITKSAFRKNSAASVKHISARLNEGFSVEDFRKVIDAKQKEWGNDPKMIKYLRPETLFGNKFEGYLQTSNKTILNGTTAINKQNSGFKPGGPGAL